MSMFDGLLDHLHFLITAGSRNFSAEDFARRMLLVAFSFFIASWLLIGDVMVFHLRLAAAVGLFIAFSFAVYLALFLSAQRRIALLESELPEFLSVMASHIRSGQTYDRALLLSSRKEFGPLAEEMERVAKETLSGTPLSESLSSLSRRVPSPAFSRTINLIVKGINSGGKLAELLEATSLDIRRFGSIRKEVAATVLVYQLFSFAATCIGAPLLYAITVFLVRIFAEARSRVGFGQFSEPPSYLPFFQGAAVSPEVTFAFALAALFITCLFGSFAAGVIAKGKESDGLPYLPVILGVSYGVFFTITIILQTMLSGFFFQ